VLECVVNISEGRDGAKLAALARACGPYLLDVHSDAAHNRSVFTVAGEAGGAQLAARGLATKAVELLDLGGHDGVHPRIGVVDVVPWVALEGWPLVDAASAEGREMARRARDSFARWASAELELPVFFYGEERSLPELRRGAWGAFGPDLGPAAPHPTAGATAVGCRPLLVAYNLWLGNAELATARSIAAGLRSPQVRALGFAVNGGVQVSCNLLAPLVAGPAWAWDEVSRLATVTRAELVGLVPQAVLQSVPQRRWAQLDLAPERTIEHHLTARAQSGPGGGH
jgi:glutamate formiminotransferase